MYIEGERERESERERAKYMDFIIWSVQLGDDNDFRPSSYIFNHLNLFPRLLTPKP